MHEASCHGDEVLHAPHKNGSARGPPPFSQLIGALVSGPGPLPLHASAPTVVGAIPETAGTTPSRQDAGCYLAAAHFRTSTCCLAQMSWFWSFSVPTGISEAGILNETER